MNPEAKVEGGIFNGCKVKPPRKGCIVGWRKGGEIVRGLNALLNWTVRATDAAQPSIAIADNGVALMVPKGGGNSGTIGTGAQRMRVQSVSGDYLTCRTWDGATEGGSDVLVAKPPELRQSVASQSIEGTTVSFAYASRTNNLDGQRTASAAGATNQVEIVLPVYMADDSALCEIWADEPEGGTGVTVDGDALTWMDTNRAGRTWVQVS